VHPREVFSEAVACSCSSIILVHNHPSGETEPSHEDIVLTNRLDECGKLLGIKVLDHIIIGDGVFYSFKEEGLI
jgi:DNA repair protein RadC